MNYSIKRPVVSIITVCYNEKNIENTCKSIVFQNFKDYEWIVIDGGSTDETINVLNKYKEHINVLISEKDNGIYDAMNKGIRLANSEWIIFMNGGDRFFDENVFKKVFSLNLDYDIMFADGANDIYNTKHPLPIDKNGQIVFHKFFCDNSLCHQATFIKRELFERIGFYDTSYEIIADHVFNYIALRDFKVTYKYIPEMISIVDIGGVSAKNKAKLLKEQFRFRKNRKDILVEIFIIFNLFKKRFFKK